MASPLRSPWRHAATFVLIAAAACATTGCAATNTPVVSTAALGQVIIYRNGVAYFERYAPAGEKELTLRVPAERVDDFLKSLTIVDTKTGETMPVSYPTLNESGGYVEMTIKLPERHNGLRMSYVTESPAWKPSYRIVLNDDGTAKLQGWAVVDNVSGEDWNKVKIGVGSTSALSFRYDLRSVRAIARETLTTGSLLAAAPPTGGSPYANNKLRVMANMDQSSLDLLTLSPMAANESDRAEEKPDETLAFRKGGSKTYKKRGKGRYGAATGHKPKVPVATEPVDASKRAMRFSTGADMQPWDGAQQQVAQLTKQLEVSGEQRIVIEGYARSDDGDARGASLARANTLREALIANGLPGDKIDAIGTGKVNNQQAVRIVQVQGGESDGKPQQAPAAAELDGQPSGQAHFVSSETMDIAADHSAMVSILAAETKAERVYYYDPISSRGSKRFAFNAVRLENPSKYTLDSGPFTVYADGQFLGEGISEPILPKSSAFIPYALDRSIIVDPKVTGREEINKLITIVRGIVTTETRNIRKTAFEFSNRGQSIATVFVRHKLTDGFKLATKHANMEKLGGAHLIPVTLRAGESLKLVIEEWTPIERSVDIRTDDGIKAIALYLRKAKLGTELKGELLEVVKRHKQSAELETRIELLEDQMGVYRTRIDEINIQLVTLRKVRQAAKLRRHLSQKMEEISNKRQDATMGLVDMKARLMASRIELQDKLAELTLSKPDASNAKKHARQGVGR